MVASLFWNVLPGGTGSSSEFLLIETGFFLLLEDGSKIILE